MRHSFSDYEWDCNIKEEVFGVLQRNSKKLRGCTAEIRGLLR